MNRQEKQQIIEAIKSDFQKSTASFLVGYRGLTVAQLTDLRKKLRENGGALHVAKVTLIKRAIDGVPTVEGLRTFLGDQIALVFSQNEPPAIAKVLSDFSKEFEQLKIVVGSFESAILDENTIKEIASLPSREVLLAQLCGTLKAPMSKLAFVVDAIIGKLEASSEKIENNNS
jgi:large subunit ribosomal protein L10